MGWRQRPRSERLDHRVKVEASGAFRIVMESGFSSDTVHVLCWSSSLVEGFQTVLFEGLVPVRENLLLESRGDAQLKPVQGVVRMHGALARAVFDVRVVTDSETDAMPSQHTGLRGPELSVLLPPFFSLRDQDGPVRLLVHTSDSEPYAVGAIEYASLEQMEAALEEGVDIHLQEVTIELPLLRGAPVDRVWVSPESSRWAGSFAPAVAGGLCRVTVAVPGSYWVKAFSDATGRFSMAKVELRPGDATGRPEWPFVAPGPHSQAVSVIRTKPVDAGGDTLDAVALLERSDQGIPRHWHQVEAAALDGDRILLPGLFAGRYRITFRVGGRVVASRFVEVPAPPLRVEIGVLQTCRLDLEFPRGCIGGLASARTFVQQPGGGWREETGRDPTLLDLPSGQHDILLLATKLWGRVRASVPQADDVTSINMKLHPYELISCQIDAHVRDVRLVCTELSMLLPDALVERSTNGGLVCRTLAGLQHELQVRTDEDVAYKSRQLRQGIVIR